MEWRDRLKDKGSGKKANTFAVMPSGQDGRVGMVGGSGLDGWLVGFVFESIPPESKYICLCLYIEKSLYLIL